MDMDWCLTCEKHTEGKSYCSRKCRDEDYSLREPCYLAASSSGDSDSDLDNINNNNNTSASRRRPTVFYTTARGAQQHQTTPISRPRTTSLLASSSSRSRRHTTAVGPSRSQHVATQSQTSSRWPGNTREGIAAWAEQIPEHSEPDVLPTPRPSGILTSTVSAVRPPFRLSHQRIAPPALTTQPPKNVICVTTTTTVSTTTTTTAATTSSPPIDTPPRRHTGSAASSMATTQTESIATPGSDGAVNVNVNGKPGVLDGLVAKVANWSVKGSGQSSSSRAVGLATKIPAFSIAAHSGSSSWDDDELLLQHHHQHASTKGPATTKGADAQTNSNSNSKPIWISNGYAQQGEYACGYGYGYWTGNAAGERAAKESRRPLPLVVAGGNGLGEKKATLVGFSARTQEQGEKAGWEEKRERERDLAFLSRGRKTAKNVNV